MKNCLTLVLGLLLLTGGSAAEYPTPKDWAITASFPKPLTVESSEQKSDIGPIKQVTVSAEDGEETFVILQINFPGKVAENQHEALYESAKQSGLREGKGVLIREEKTAVADHEGRRYLVDFPVEKHRAEFCLTVIGHVLYMAGYEAPVAIYSAARARAFFRSLQPRTDQLLATGVSVPEPRLPVKNGVAVTQTAAQAMPKVAPTPTTAGAEKTKPEPWALEADFPRPPKTLSSEQPSPVGPVRQATLAAAEGQIVYALSRIAFPMEIAGDQIDATFETTRDNLVRQGKGTLQREEKITVAGQPGHRYVVEYHDFVLDDYRVDYRVVLIDRTMYMAFYRAPVNIYSAEKARAFFKTVKRTSH